MSSSTRSCVICVGSTGAGKSATIQRCTKKSVPSGNGHDRVTNKCTKYDLTAEAKADLEAWAITKEVIDLTWVDTVGWDDADLQGKSRNLSAVTIPLPLSTHFRRQNIQRYSPIYFQPSTFASESHHLEHSAQL